MAAAGGGRNPLLIGGVVLAVVAAAAIAIGFVALAGGDDDAPSASAADFDAAVKAADCTVKEFPIDKGGDHIAATDPDPPSWDSDPPTHGPHDPVWAIWGQYDTEVAQRNLVHNLEHAGLVIQYGPKVPADQLAALKNAVLEDTEWTVLVAVPQAQRQDRLRGLGQAHRVQEVRPDRARPLPQLPQQAGRLGRVGPVPRRPRLVAGRAAAGLVAAGGRMPQDDERAGRACAPPARCGSS